MNILNRKEYWIILFILIFFIGLYSKVLDRIEIIVGKEPILKSEIDRGLELLSSPFFPSVKKDSIKESYINSLINKKILYIIAKEESIKIDSSLLNKDIDNYMENMIKNFPDKQAYREFLRTNNLNESMLREFYFMQRELSYIKQQLVLKKGYSINIREQQVKDFYETNRDSFKIPLTFDLYHISFIISPDSITFMGTLQKVDALINALRKGNSFEELAMEYSDDKKTSKRGGYVGKIAFKDMNQEIANFLYKFKDSDTLLYTQSRNGFHIIKILNTYIDSIEYKQIFVRFDVDTEDTLRVLKKAEKVRQMIINKQITFEQAASEYSDDIMTKHNGGYIGKVSFEQLQDELKKELENLPEDKVSNIIKGDFGFELFMVKNREGNRIQEYDEVKQFIRNMLESKEIDAYIDRLIEDKKKSVFIKFLNE